MPPAVGVALVEGMPEFGALLAGASVGATIAVQLGTMVVLGAVSKKLAADAAKSQQNQNNQRDLTVRATDAYENFVYGKALVAGLTVYNNAVQAPGAISNTGTPNNRYVHVVKWAGHVVNCLEYFRLDDRNLHPTSDAISWNPTTYVGSGYVNSGQFHGFIDDQNTPYGGTESPTRLRWYDGNQTSADYWLPQMTGDWPAASAIGKKRAYGVLEIAQVNDQSITDRVFAQGMPSNVYAYVHGVSVYDPRRFALNGDPWLLEVGSWWSDNLLESRVGGKLDIGSAYMTGLSTSQMVQGVGGYTNKALRVTSYSWVVSELMPIDVGSGAPFSGQNYYRAEWIARQTSGTSVNYPFVAFYTDVGSHIGGGVSDATGWGLGTFHYPSFANQAFPSTWSSYAWTIGSGQNGSIPTSARYMRIGVLAVYSASASVVEIQQAKISFGQSSSQLVNVSTTQGWRDNPALCAADYLRNEGFGFGRENRLPINGSRYALNSDPCFRRDGNLATITYWRYGDVGSGLGSAASAVASIATNLIGAPVGRRAVVIPASAGSPAGSGSDYLSSAPFPIDPSGVYAISLWGLADGPKIANAGIRFLNAVGSYIGLGVALINNAQLPTAAWSNYVMLIGSGTANTIPASARNAVLFLYQPRSYGANGATNHFYQEFVVQAGSYIRRYIEPWEQIDWRSVNSAAAYCDAAVVTPSGTQARFSCNGVGTTGTPHRDNLNNILASGNLRVTYTQSGWRFFGGWQQPDVILNAADVIGNVQIRGALDTNERINGLSSSIYDRHQDHKLVPTPTVVVSDYVARDNSLRMMQEIQLPFVNDWFQAQRVMFGRLDQADNQVTLKGRLGARAIGLQVGQQFAIKLDVLSWSPKYFTLSDAAYDATGVDVTAREDFSASYTDPGTWEYIPRSMSFDVASAAAYVPWVSSVTVNPKYDGVELAWVNPSRRAYDTIEIWQNTTNAFSGSTLRQITKDDHYFVPARPSDLYYWWFRTRDIAGAVSSVYPGLTTSFWAAAVSQVAQDPEYVFLEEFNYNSVDELEAKWERVSVAYPAGITFPQSGVIGGKVISVSSGQAWYSSRIRIPFDTGALYQMTVTLNSITSRDNQGYVYAGFTQFRADGTTAIDATSNAGYGSQLYFVLNGFREDFLGTSYGLWREFTGHVRGTMPWPGSGTFNKNNYNHTADPGNAARAHDLTRYVSPMFLLNYNGATGLQSIDTIKVRKITPGRTVTIDPYVTVPSNWVMVANTAVRSTDYLNAKACVFNVIAVQSVYNTITLVNTGASQYGAFALEKFNPALHRYITDASSLKMSWETKTYVENIGVNSSEGVGAWYLIYTATGSVATQGALVRLIAGTDFPYNTWSTIGRSQTLPNSLINTTSYPPPYYLSMGPYVSPGAFGAVCSAHIAYFRGDVSQS